MNLPLSMLYLRRLTLFSIGMILCLLAPALASNGVSPTGGALADSLRVVISAVIEVGIGAVVAWAAARINRLTGINIEARHREALHSALATGAGIAIDRIAGGELRALRNPVTRGAAVDTIVQWVEKSTPDAIAYFQRKGQLPQKELLELAIGTLGDRLVRDLGTSADR